MLALFVNVQTM